MGHGFSLALFDVTKAWHRPVLQGLSLEVGAGERVLVTGPSGSGKSTLFGLVYGLFQPDAGQVLVGGRNLARLKGRALAGFRRSVGFVFQDLQLCEDRSALWNVSLPLRFQGVWGQQAVREARRACLQLGLEEQALGVRVSELSRGDRQLVAVARAIVGDRRLVLADEPTAHLDTRRALRVLDVLSAAAASGATVLVATGEMLAMGAFRADREYHLVDGRAEWNGEDAEAQRVDCAA